MTDSTRERAVALAKNIRYWDGNRTFDELVAVIEAALAASVAEPDGVEVKHDARNVSRRIVAYLTNGGLFNPEQMEHDKVSQLLIDCREALRAAAEKAPASDEFHKFGGDAELCTVCGRPISYIKHVVLWTSIKGAKETSAAEKAPAPRLSESAIADIESALINVQAQLDNHYTLDRHDVQTLCNATHSRLAAEKAAPAASLGGTVHRETVCALHGKHLCSICFPEPVAATPLNADEIVEACAVAAEKMLNAQWAHEYATDDWKLPDDYVHPIEAIRALKGRFSLAAPQVREETKK